jgi:hypothetical protein
LDNKSNRSKKEAALCTPFSFTSFCICL